MPGAQRANLKRRIAIRAALLLLAGISLYLLAPSLLDVFSWPSCRLNPLWLGLAVFFEGEHAFWTLRRILSGRRAGLPSGRRSSRAP